MFALWLFIRYWHITLQKKSGPPEGMLQEFCRIAGTSAGIDQSAEPLASILGVKNDDPTFFFARINSHAQEHTYENQLRGGFAEHFLPSPTGRGDLACLGAFVRNGHRHDIVLCRLTDLSIDSKPVGALSLGSNRKPFLSKSSVTNLASFRLLKLLRRLKDINIAEASRYLP